MVANNSRWKVCGEAVDGSDAIAKAQRLQPDVIVMDITMQPVTGLEATREILKTYPRTRILILTMHESEQVVREVMKAGAQGYVLKSDADRDLLAGLKAITHGEKFFTTKVARMVVEGYVKGHAQVEQASRLSPRQREVVQVLCSGKSNKEAATTLGISVKTIETHRHAIMKKLEFSSFSDLVRYAVRERIIEA